MSKFAYWVPCESVGPVPCVKTAWAEGCPLPDAYFKNRPVYFGDVHLDGVDSYFESAWYADTDEALDDDELYQLENEQGDYLVTENMEHFGYFKK